MGTKTDIIQTDILSLWRQRLLNAILLGTIVITPIAVGINLLEGIRDQNWIDTAIPSAAFLLLALLNIRRIPYAMRVGGMIVALYMLALNGLYDSGIRGDSRLYLIILTVFALIFWGKRPGWIALGWSSLTYCVAAWAIVSGKLAPTNLFDMRDADIWIERGAITLLVTLALMLSFILLQEGFFKAHERESQAIENLQRERQLLESRVADRTRAIQASAEVSRRLSTILDQRQLMLAVVEEVQRAFDYYHAQIYLFDEMRTNLVLVGGTGEAGQAMLARSHKIPKERGLVGRAVATNQVVLVADTQSESDWLPNPLLPDTKSEVAVPIAIAERVLGVLDVQHNIVNGLTWRDAELLQAIANQVAIAVQNASLFTQTQRQAERETLVNTIGQKIQSTASMEEVLQVLVRELGQAMDTKEARVVLDSTQTGG